MVKSGEKYPEHQLSRASPGSQPAGNATVHKFSGKAASGHPSFAADEHMGASSG